MKIYQVLKKFDSKKDYEFDINPQHGQCLTVMKNGETLNSKQFVKDHKDEFTSKRNTLDANLAVTCKAISTGCKLG